MQNQGELRGRDVVLGVCQPVPRTMSGNGGRCPWPVGLSGMCGVYLSSWCAGCGAGPELDVDGSSAGGPSVVASGGGTSLLASVALAQLETWAPMGRR